MLNSLRPLLEGLGNLSLPRMDGNAQGPLRYGAPVGTHGAALKLSLTPFRHVGANQNGVRFTYPVSVTDLAWAGRCAGRTPAKRWVLKQGSESTFSEIRQVEIGPAKGDGGN